MAAKLLARLPGLVTGLFRSGRAGETPAASGNGDARSPVRPRPAPGLVAELEAALTAESGMPPEACRQALEEALADPAGFLPALGAKNLLPEATLLAAAARVFGLQPLEYVPDELLDYDLAAPFPINYLKANLAVPLRLDDGTPAAALADPCNSDVVDDLRRTHGAPFAVLFLAPADAVTSAVNRVYGRGAKSADPIDWNLREGQDLGLVELHGPSGEDLLDQSNSAPVIKAVNQIITKAVKSGASDIHIEPGHDGARVRYRLDGVLHHLDDIPKSLHAAVISRIKIMARLNIAEKRLPQDGRIEVKLGERLADLRVSTIPTAHGERAVMRLLEKSARLRDLGDLGFSPDNLAAVEKALATPHGIILATGPTGSGKTTTLYAALSRIKTPERNIMTIEDPVEYQIEGVSQMQVNPKIGLTFASGLRAMVRQDPDVMLIGEIRDKETADIAVQAAMTGHLVFSTLHTNDAATAVTRLLDMGLAPFQLTSACRLIVAQRLVRTLCPDCRRPEPPTDEDLAEMQLPRAHAPEFLYSPGGCTKCFNTGYKGRTAIYELLPVSQDVQELVMRRADANQIRHLAKKEGMTTMRLDGVRKVLLGVTSMREVIRATMFG